MKKMLLGFILMTLLSCYHGAEVKELKGGWLFVSQGKQNTIDGSDKHIPCNVLEYDNDNDFIIVSQKPTNDCFLGKDTSIYKAGKDKVYYWLVIKKQNLILGPMNETEFIQTREKYKVSDNLKLEPIY